MKAARRGTARGGLELCEEAVHLLRQNPSLLASYYIGALPFVLGGLYFWTDMSRSPQAYEHLAGAALGLAAAFLWMKFWQSVFAANVQFARTSDAASRAPALTLQRAARMFTTQSLLQSTGLFLLPLAAIIIVPFPWLYSFYQHLTALGDSDVQNARTLVKNAAKQTALWPRQLLVLLLILFGFGFFVFLNWSMLCLTLPGLIKLLFGVESVFTRSGISMLNTTFFAVMLGLSYLSVDPILKTVFVLRCFYGQSRDSGADLTAELNYYSARAVQAAACLVLAVNLMARSTRLASTLLCSFVFFCGNSPVLAATVEPSPPTPVAPADLDSAMNRVLQQSKYTWRMPREKLEKPATESGPIGRFIARVAKMLRSWLRTVRDWVIEWLRKHLNGRSRGGDSGSGYGWMLGLQILLYGLLAVTAAALALLIYRAIANRNRKPPIIAAQPLQPVPDLSDENVSAEQLPEDGWIRMGRELLERGELRLALRAFYLASLAHLAGRNLISLAKFKSNRDYERELRRRAHSFPEVLANFDESVQVFDRVWYGMHEVNGELVNQFLAKVQSLKAST